MNSETSLFKLRMFPGIGICLGLALVALGIESILPLPIIGASLLALLMGLFIKLPKSFDLGVQFTSKRLLKFAIILLGASLNIGIIVSVGKTSMWVMVFTLLTCFGGGYFVGKALGLDWKLSNLISAGTGICGGSAIAAIAPVIEADDASVAYAMSATFLFDMIMIFAFPIMGRLLGMSDFAFGLWTGTAVNDTSSVIAAAYAFSEQAGEYATMVKLTRTLSIIPTVLIFSLITNYKKTSHSKVSLISLFPWFIVGFITMSLLNTVGIISPDMASMFKIISKFLMIMSLGAIGLSTNINEMKKSGVRPMIHGFTISLLVVLVSYGVMIFMNLV